MSDEQINAGIRLTGDASGAKAAFKAATEEAERYKASTESAGAASGAKLEQAGQRGAKGLQELGKATAFTRSEMLALNYTASDVVASLASGGSPMTILLQQGGQVRDQFGGFGNLFTKLGANIKPVAVGFAAVALVVGTVASAAYAGDREITRLNQTLRLTGNYAGITTGQYEAMASSIAAASNSSISQAKDVLMELAGSGTVVGKNMALMGEVINRVRLITGQTASEISADFANMGNDVAKWAEEHNRRYHFITAAQWEYIRSLQEAGKVQEAQRVTLDALNVSLQRNQEVLGFFPWLFDEASKSAGDFWNWLKKIGKPETVDDALAAAEKRLKRQRDLLNDPANSLYGKDRIAQAEAVAKAEKEVDALRTARDNERNAAEARSIDAQKQQAGIAAQQTLLAIQKETDSRSRVTKEVERYTRAIKEAQAAGLPVPSAGEQQRAIAAITEKYRDKSGDTKVKDAAEQAYRSAIANQEGLQQRQADSLRAHLEDLSSLRRRDLVDEADYIRQSYALQREGLEAQIQIAKSEAEIARKNGKTGDAARYDQEAATLQARQTDLVRQEKNATLELADARRRAFATFGQSFADEAEQIRFETTLIGKNADEIERLTVARKAEQAARRATINADGSTNSNVDAQAYSDAAQRGRDEQLQAIADRKAAEDAYNADWKNGAAAAFEDYSKNAKNAADVSKEAFTSTFRHAEDAMTQWVTTGKFSSAELARSILADLARIAIKQAIVYATQTTIKAMGYANGGVVEGGTEPNANGAAYSRGALVPLANGSVLDRPTQFMANGGRRILAGEAGDEGILPLRRTRDGKLGVISSGGGGGDVIITNYVTVEGSGDDPQGQGDQIAAKLEQRMREIAISTIIQQKNVGGVLQGVPS